MSENVAEQAKRLLARSAMAADLKKGGRLEPPIPILHPGGGLEGWFVPVALGPQMAGFFRFLADTTLLGYSELPAAGRTSLAIWIDPNTIRAHAEALLRLPGAAGDAVLSYDGVPARLAWRVPFAASGRTVYVAGGTAYEASR